MSTDVQITDANFEPLFFSEKYLFPVHIWSRGRAEKEPRISIPVPAVPVSELLAGKSQRICNSLNWFKGVTFTFWIKIYRKNIFPKINSKIYKFYGIFLQDILYRHCRNRNTNSCFLFRSPPKNRNPYCKRQTLQFHLLLFSNNKRMQDAERGRPHWLFTQFCCDLQEILLF